MPHRQIVIGFDEVPPPTDETVEVEIAPTADSTDLPVAPKKRGRKPKPAPLVAPKPAKRGRMSLKELGDKADLIEVPDDEQLFTKQYYAMGQVAEMFHASQSLIRMWSREFSAFLNMRTNKKGDRYFRPEDVKTLQLIHHLLRERKFTIEGARTFLKKNKHADERFSLVQSLQKIKSFLLELKSTL